MTTLVVVPTYNEAQNVGVLVAGLLDLPDPPDVLVVDDASPDGTADLVRTHVARHRGVHLLERPGKDGLGSAYRAGFAWARDRGYDVVVQMDADLSHPVDAVPRLVAALEHADVAIGSRYVPGGRTVGWPLRRRLLSAAGNLYVRTVLRLPVHDTTAGFRAFRAPVLDLIDACDTRSHGYAFQIETTWRAVLAGCAVAEVPITFTERARGSSKMSTAIAVEAVVEVTRWRLRGAPVLAGRQAHPVLHRADGGGRAGL